MKIKLPKINFRASMMQHTQMVHLITISLRLKTMNQQVQITFIIIQLGETYVIIISIKFKEYNMELPGTLLSSSLKKFLKKVELSGSKIKKFLILLEMELSDLIFLLYFKKELLSSKNKKKLALKKFLIFSQKKAFIIFWETETFLYFLKNVFLIFLEMELSIPKNKTFEEVTF